MELNSNQVKLVMPGHCSSLGKVLLQSLSSCVFTDLKIVTTSDVFPVHKVFVLKAISKLISIDFTLETDIVHFPEVDSDNMKAAIEELYVENQAIKLSKLLGNYSGCFETNTSELNMEEVIGGSEYDIDVDDEVSVKVEAENMAIENRYNLLQCVNCFQMFRREARSQGSLCDECEKMSTSKQKQGRHKVRIEKKTKKVTCELCGKQFSSLYITEHKAVMHQTQGVRKCLECNFETFSKTVLKDHRNKIHNKDTFPCSLCGKIFQTWKLRYDHESKVHSLSKSETDEIMLTCEFCGKVFNQKYKLMSHVKRLHNLNDTYDCNVCKKQFTSEEYLKKHVRGHEDKKPCPYCNKLYTFASMVYHKRNCNDNPGVI